VPNRVAQSYVLGAVGVLLMQTMLLADRRSVVLCRVDAEEVFVTVMLKDTSGGSMACTDLMESVAVR
jgi:hypothetical protein